MGCCSRSVSCDGLTSSYLVCRGVAQSALHLELSSVGGRAMTTMAVEKTCTMLVYSDKPGSPSEIKEALEGKDPAAQIQAMQRAITMLLNGEQLPALFITIVRCGRPCLYPLCVTPSV